MAYNKKTWKARQGLGLNKFSIDGATPVPVVNQPDSITQQGDALSAGNLNDLEQRIADAFDDVEESKADKSTTEALQSQINQHESRLENLEQKAGDYTTVQYRGTDAVPTGKAKNGLVEKIVGKSRAWNQLLNKSNYDSSKTVNNVTFTNNADGSISIQTTSSGASSNANFDLGVSGIINGHKYMVVLGKAVESLVLRNNTTASLNISNAVADIKTSDMSADNVAFSIRVYSGVVISTAIKVVPQLFDLTLIFGSGNEPSTVADALAQLPALGLYNAYNADSLVDTVVSGAKSVGVNIFDEEMESGYWTSYGTKSSSDTNIRAKNYLPVLPNTSYYYLFPTGTAINSIVYFDINKNFISSTGIGNSGAMTTPANCAFMSFSTNSAYGTVYNHDIQVCLNSLPDAIKTTYHPYKTGTLSLSETVTLRSAGSVADTDELNVEVLVNGQKVEKRRQTTRVGGGAIGTGWSYNATRQAWAKSITGIKTDSDLLASDYLFIGIVRSSSQVQKMTVGTCAINGTTIFVKNGSDSVAPSGYLYYALATESVTLLDPIINNTIQVEGGGTINTIQTQTPVIDNCLDVGYLTV